MISLSFLAGMKVLKTFREFSECFGLLADMRVLKFFRN